MTFSKEFVWGAATAAYQIEGAAFEDGKGLSVWDTMCRKEDAIKCEHNGDVACDHYHRYKEDVALMKEIELQAYRFSISWPRVIPDGVGAVNQKGIDFYDKLVDELLEKGIQPYITLFHWDYPYELYKRGGWLNIESPEWFAEYTKVIVDRLSDRVKNWMTLNEPQCFIHLGHREGNHAPGVKLGKKDILQAIHNTLLAHGRSVQVIRERSKQPCRVGFAPVGQVRIPSGNSAEEIELVRESMFQTADTFCNAWWMDPVYLGYYPEDGLKAYEADMPKIGQNDLKTISQPLDFFGVNTYFGRKVMKNSCGELETVQSASGGPRTAFGWDVTPECLYWGPKFFYERYKKPIYITENGLSNVDWIALDGRVHDPQRIDFIQRYLMELHRAIAAGVDVRGYFTWSLLDNFEWAAGYTQRFGMIYVDYQTQKRIIKDSGYWYNKVIRSNGEHIFE